MWAGRIEHDECNETAISSPTLSWTVVQYTDKQNNLTHDGPANAGSRNRQYGKGSMLRLSSYYNPMYATLPEPALNRRTETETKTKTPLLLKVSIQLNRAGITCCHHVSLQPSVMDSVSSRRVGRMSRGSGMTRVGLPTNYCAWSRQRRESTWRSRIVR